MGHKSRTYLTLNDGWRDGRKTIDAKSTENLSPGAEDRVSI